MRFKEEIEMAAFWFDVSVFDNKRGCFEIQTFTDKYGNISFFPKKNKVHIHKNNQWITRGHRWIKKLCMRMEKGTFNDQVEKSNLKDSSIMRFGKFKGSPLDKVPDWWLIWIEGKLKGDNNLDSFRKNLLLYIEENRDVIDG